MWNVVTGTSQQADVNSGYIANNAGLVTITLPATAPVGTELRVVGLGAGGWRIAQNANQVIHWTKLGVNDPALGGGNLTSTATSTTTGTGGHLDSASRYDRARLLCVVANTDWVVESYAGLLAST